MEAVDVISPILYNSLFLLSVNKRFFSLFPPALLMLDNAIMEFTVCWSELTSCMVRERMEGALPESHSTRNLVKTVM